MSRPSWAAGPVSAADWPRTTWVSVTPCEKASVLARAASRDSIRFIVSPSGILGLRGEDHNGGLRPEELPDLVHEAFLAGAVAAAVLAVELLHLPQQLLLAVGEAHRGLDHHLAQQVTRVGGPHALDALAAQAEHLAG